MPIPLILSLPLAIEPLLQTLGLSFQQISPNVDESPRTGEAPRICLRLAQDKARDLARRHPDAVVIGSDQVGTCEQRLLSKPGTPAKAIQSLLQSSGKLATFYTALALARTSANGKIEVTGDISLTQLKFRDLSTEQIAFYVEQDMPTDAAGAFKAEGLGISLFDYVRAVDPALIGLRSSLTTRLRNLYRPLSGKFLDRTVWLGFQLRPNFHHFGFKRAETSSLSSPTGTTNREACRHKRSAFLLQLHRRIWCRPRSDARD